MSKVHPQVAKLLLCKREEVASSIHELRASSDVPMDAVITLAEAQLVIIDVLELLIRRDS